MKKGYWYLGVIWPSISDCNEMALATYEEQVYEYAMKRLAEGWPNWIERTARFERVLKSQAQHKSYREVMIAD